MTETPEKSPSEQLERPDRHDRDETVAQGDGALALPYHITGSGTLERLVETARDYACAAASENTLKAYGKDWAHFARWCRMRGADPFPSSPQLIGLYIPDLAAPGSKATALSVSSIERRLSGLTWRYAQRGERLDRKDRHIASVLAGIRRKHARPPAQKEAILPEDLRDMLATLPHDLRGLRDRAILLIGFSRGLRRSEIVSLDHGKDDSPDSGGWVEILEDGALITLRGKTGWREVEIARGSSDQTCPVHALTQWLHYARIGFGSIFVATSRNGLKPSARGSSRAIPCVEEHLISAYCAFGERLSEARQRAEVRIEAIITTAKRLCTAPYRGEPQGDLLPGLRHLPVDNAVSCFVPDPHTRQVRVLAVFFSAQDHQRHMLVRLLQKGMR